MVNLTKSLLDAISIIADKTIDEVSSDKTIKAVIKKSISTSEGKYLVTYNDGDFYAYTQSGATDVYQVDEQIYILVPEGDMSQKKFIIGRVKDENEDVSSLKTPTSSLLNDYVVLGTNAIVDKEYGSLVINRMQPLQLELQESGSFYYCYVKDKTEINQLEIDYDSITYPVVSIDEESFTNSAKQAEALLIRAKFKTDINTKNIGHYGIIVNIAFEDKTNPQMDEEGNTVYPPKIIAYMLDTNKMTGNPMKFYDYTSQYMIAAFDGENYLYIDSIVAFSDGFDDIIEDSIYIDDIEIIALDEVSAISGDYKMKLTTPLGNTIKAGRRDNLKIVSKITYLNQDITKNAVFYWGVRDPLVTSNDDNYHAKLGAGYRYLNNVSTNELLLTPSDLTAAENVFVCVGVYESDIILKTSVLLYNNNNNLKITIESDQGTSFQFNEGNPTLTCLINGKVDNYQEVFSDSAFSFIWSKEDNENGSILLDKTQAQLEREKEAELNECSANQETHRSNAGRTPVQVLSYYSTQISQVKNISYPNGVHGPRISCNLKNINNYITYSCSVYRGGIYVGYGSITLQNSKKVINTSYYITITNGTQVFQYDESGIAPNSIKKQNPIEVLDLVATFHSPQGAEVTPKKVRWIVPTDNTLINIPSLGLETNLETNEKYFVGSVYPLSIKENYDSNCNNNQVIAVVTHEDGTEYRQSSNLLFTKIGEIGTNGTDITVKINELINVPEDECLTIIKNSDGNIIYNTGDSINTAILEANLYMNNDRVLGHSTKWTVAGSSDTQSQNYRLQTTSEGACVINYINDNSKLDTRIIKAQTSLNGKYFSSFYGIPAIEYFSGFNYISHPIKIMRNGTLKSILYDSKGMNPSYDNNQGVRVKLGDWSSTGYLKWTVEGGPQRNNSYDNINLLLSRVPKSKTGSKELFLNNNVENIQSFILNAQDTGKICAENAELNIKQYIKEFITDIEKICLDNILTVSNKIDLLWNRLGTFSDKTPDKKNIYIKRVYEEYKSLFEQIINEYQDCQNINKECTEIYNQIQNIWRSEWPSVITEDRLCVKSNTNIHNIQQLNNIYQNAYDNRSNDDNIEILNREDIFEEDFLTLLNHNEKGLDKYYNDYITALGLTAISKHPILVEYAKILIAYIYFIVNETQDYLNNNNEIKNKYNFAYNDWAIENNSGNTNTLDYHVIGKSIYDIVIAADEIAANIYNDVRNLYEYYQSLYLNIPKYQITEESQTLNIWNSMLREQDPNLLEQIYVVPNNIFNGLYMNNNIVGTAFIKNSQIEIPVAKIYVPIIMTLNTYELGSLNGWDGTNIDIGEDHIMTPQIGAGIKDDVTNTFTGMVMGVVGSVENENSINNKKVDKTGLIGYYNGQQSLFIDSKTGAAYFGLPEDDVNTINNQNDANATIGTNEGRIELIPGGVSKIGNWKIGSRFLYNIIDGNYEKRLDKEARGNSPEYKLMVPHDKHGIILSSDQPYIHVKGEIYDDENLTGINYNDEYNNINPGDSLELRMDSDNKSLFSIIQHTAGFGDEDFEDLFFGYRLDSDFKVKNYIANENAEDAINQIGEGIKYFIYRLKTDANGQYQPYYKVEETQNNLDKVNTWNTNFSILSGTQTLNNNLTYYNFQRAFTLNSNNGVITYNPDDLLWINNNNNNNNHWESNTPRVSSTVISPIFRYNKISDSSIIQNKTIGQIKQTGDEDIYQIKLSGCNISRTLTQINLNNSNNAYIQFYIVPNENYNIDDTNVLLKSSPINLWNNYNNINIELFSVNNKHLVKNNVYYLKMYVYIDIYNIDATYTFPQIAGNFISYYAPPQTQYDVTKITNNSNGSYSIVNTNGFTVFYNYNSGKIKFYINGNDQYDFILWRQQNNNNNVIIGCGRTGNSNTNYSKFFTSTSQSWNDLNDYVWITDPSSNNPICISFYPLGTYTIEETMSTTTNTSISGQSTNGTQDNTVNINYTYTTSGNATYTKNMSESYGVTNTSESDNINNAIDQNITTSIIYKLISNVIPITNTYEYININWNVLGGNNYNSIQAIWNINITTNFNNISLLGSTPDTNVDADTLCIEGSTVNKSIQGIPYAETYWEINNNNIAVQKIKFYKNYYDWVNNSNKPKTQYGYIDISTYQNKYYKYIKTLKKKDVNDWFTDGLTNDLTFTHGTKINGTNTYSWISISLESDNFKKAIFWKEFVRVGLDENGRFFSAGIQDKKTYSRTGKIYSFGKIPNLYGQEIRIQRNSNKYVPILKVFSDFSDLNTTYITQGENDNGNISIRTSEDNHYIELVTSQSSDNEINTIPEKTGYLKISNNKGVQIQHNNIITLVSNDNILINGKKATLKTANSYASCEFSEPVIKENDQDKIIGQIKLNATQYDFRIDNKNYSQFFIDDNQITFKAGSNNGIRFSVTEDSAQIKVDNDHCIIINKADKSDCYFKARNMCLKLQNDNAIILQNTTTKNKLYMYMGNDEGTDIIKLKNATVGLDIDDKITIYGNNGLLISNGSLVVDKTTELKGTTSVINGQLYIGSNSNNSDSCIYLYWKDNTEPLKIYANHLKQLFDWYNTKRWGIAVNGNTVWLRNIEGNPKPEGYISGSTYYWTSNFSKFSGY